MTKTTKALLVATFSVTLIALVTGTTALSAAAASYTMGKVDANDLSFYQPSDTTAPYPQASGTKVRNVIFCIGDGMDRRQRRWPASSRASGSMQVGMNSWSESCRQIKVDRLEARPPFSYNVRDCQLR